MHQGHDEEDFQPPFELDPDKPAPELAAGKNPSAHISSLTICLRSIHQVFDALLKSDNEFIQTSPTPVCSVSNLVLRVFYLAIAMKNFALVRPILRAWPHHPKLAVSFFCSR